MRRFRLLMAAGVRFAHAGSDAAARWASARPNAHCDIVRRRLWHSG